MAAVRCVDPSATPHDVSASLALLLMQRDLPAPAAAPAPLEPSLLQVLGAASVKGRIALGPKAGAYVPRLGRGSMDGGGEFRHGKLCADVDGLSLHAGTRIPSFAREKLEPLCRYAARPPLVHERLSLSTDGHTLLYKLERRYRDGSTHVVLDPLTLIERLAALILRPRVHLTTYHGVFAPAASLRHQIVPPAPEPVAEHNTDCDHPHPRPESSKRGPALPIPHVDLELSIDAEGDLDSVALEFDSRDRSATLDVAYTVAKAIPRPRGFHMDHARLANRENGSDFRLVVRGTVVIRSVTIHPLR